MTLLQRREGERAPRRSWRPLEAVQEWIRWHPRRELSKRSAADASGPAFDLREKFVPAFDVGPAFDVREEKDRYVVRADLPGLSKDNLDLEVLGDQLTVSGHREQEQREEHDQVFTHERRYGAFSHSFTLPASADPDNIEAELKKGVLTINVAKKRGREPRRVSLFGKRRPEDMA